MSTPDRVFWSEEEKADLVDKVAQRVLSHPAKTLLAHLQGAIAQMPSDRQRVINTLQALKWFEPAIEKAIATKLHTLEVAARERDEFQKKLAENQEWIETLVSRNTTLEGDFSRLQLQMEADSGRVEEALGNASVAQLLGALQAHLFIGGAGLLDRLVAGVEVLHGLADRLGHPVSANGQPPKSKPRPKLPRVLIAGLNVKQFATVEAMFGGRVTMLHLDITNRSTGRAKTLPTAELAVIVSRFSDHGTQQNFMNMYGRDNVLVAPPNSGLTGVTKLLSERIPKLTKIIT